MVRHRGTEINCLAVPAGQRRAFRPASLHVFVISNGQTQLMRVLRREFSCSVVQPMVNHSWVCCPSRNGPLSILVSPGCCRHGPAGARADPPGQARENSGAGCESLPPPFFLRPPRRFSGTPRTASPPGRHAARTAALSTSGCGSAAGNCTIARRPGAASSSVSVPPCSCATASTSDRPSPAPGVPRLSSAR